MICGSRCLAHVPPRVLPKFVDHLARVQLCVRTQICDEALSKELFCADVAILSAVDNREKPNEKVFPVSFSKECTGYKAQPE